MLYFRKNTFTMICMKPLQNMKSVVYKITEIEMENNSPNICFSTYVGGGAALLDEFIGTPCLVYETVSDEWASALDTQDMRGGLTTLENPEFPDKSALVFETGAGTCAHFAMMDLSDPAVWRVLDVWIEQRCFVTVQHVAGRTLFNGCRLRDETIQMLKEHRDSGREHSPAAFGRFAQLIGEQRVFDMYMKKMLELLGHPKDVAPLVEMQVLTDAEVRQPNLKEPTPAREKMGRDFLSPNSGSTPDLIPAPMGLVRMAKNFSATSSFAAKMRPRSPVLVCSIDMARYMEVSRTEGCFGFGHFRVGDRGVLSFRLQSGGAQVYWLADAADPRAWATVDNIRKGEVGFMLMQGIDAVFLPLKLEGRKDGVDSVRAESLSHPGGLSDVASYLANSGMVQRTATTDIPGMELNYVQVNVLSFDSSEAALYALQQQSVGTVFNETGGLVVDVMHAGETVH